MGTKRKLKSPFMLILLSTLLLYSLTLIKRLKKQKQNYGKKQSVFPNFLSDYFSSYYENTVTLYIITPTYPRPEQLPELTRLSQTLMVSFKKYKIPKLDTYFFVVGKKCQVDCCGRCKYTNFSSITVAQTDTESIT